ncbi:MAG: glutamate--tRNA ligase [Bacteroidota bacterium]|jgi:glutamyl-tRNA synthetase|nr:glutamate--tRNA ligase [Ignavibacteria bacterium]MCU7497900.1 glutamate--tRNA ligase [Ignavibacteria bacterium]MCU7511181.1 glutamate--tRNA ligase [Ignavibacteria bacterium]MCU7518727.1 glutamate--tRNA ligase [Ignavibacteria bacterium]MCU7522870.1 glutamate--tRNA ligase [Ignavibacteria bacterium]
MISEHPRVRFAPSPTGYLHVGGLRTALYNYLFAKNQNGKFILRIEDTDRNRYVEGAVENLINVLKWIGLDYDEGPQKGGEYGPYMQSERLDIYKKYADELIEKGHAYYCFCTPERLTELKEDQRAKGLQPKYDKHCLSLSKEEVEEKLKSGMPYVVRLNIPPDLKVAFDDIVRGRVEFDSNGIDDQVLIKSDGYPTYHMANVVDDHFMKITHVVRGEEWLSSTPKHVLLYDAFGWEKPQFAHLPLLLNPDRSKLSKRQGDVAVEDYRAKGYLKEALLNFVALLGWNAGDDVEFYHLDEMVKKFSLERVNKSGAVFDLAKLNWLNAEHLRKMPEADLLNHLKEELSNSKFKDNTLSDEYLLKVIAAMKERVSFVKEFLEKSPYFFERPEGYEENAVKKSWKENTPELLDKLIEGFERLDNPKKEDYEDVLHKTAEELQVGNAKLIHPVRLAVSGVSAGPGLFDMLDILGKEETVLRLKTAIEKIKIQ